MLSTSLVTTIIISLVDCINRGETVESIVFLKANEVDLGVVIYEVVFFPTSSIIHEIANEKLDMVILGLVSIEPTLTGFTILVVCQMMNIGEPVSFIEVILIINVIVSRFISEVLRISLVLRITFI